ncbi:MAG: hypothetical protein JXB00_06185 [Bacteroidales bacterium]|nr:hypothetical protein [Bacteroidales bacterium]
MKVTIKNKIWILIIIILFLYRHTLFSQDNFPSGARVSALSGAGTTFTDLWASYHNQAGLAYIEDFTLGFHYENKYAFSLFSLQSFALAVPTGSGTIGANISVFGNPDFFESKMALAFGKSFGEKFSAGIQLNMLGVYQSEDFGDMSVLAVEGGILARPADKLSLALHVYNPTGASFKKFSDKEVPVIFQAGLGYQLSEKLLLVAEAEKNSLLKGIFTAGAEYFFIKSVCARIGFSTNEYSNYSFGFGFVQKRIRADMAFSEHKLLGYSAHFSLSYSF